MKLVLTRLQLDPDVTIGRLTVDGQWSCWVCEDAVRPPGVKVYGRTAIPYGSYRIDITMSARFKRPLPLLLDVPMFSGIRVHPGNTAADTEGCLLPGLDRLPKGVGRSRLAFDQLQAQLVQAKARGESITIDIVQAAA